MRIGLQLEIKDALVVDAVNSHLPRRMDNTVVAHIDAHMHYPTLIVGKKAQVVGLSLIDGIHLIALSNLLRCITQQLDATRLETDLRKSRAINP